MTSVIWIHSQNCRENGYVEVDTLPSARYVAPTLELWDHAPESYFEPDFRSDFGFSPGHEMNVWKLVVEASRFVHLGPYFKTRSLN